jgi:hypothetical protein
MSCYLVEKYKKYTFMSTILLGKENRLLSTWQKILPLAILSGRRKFGITLSLTRKYKKPLPQESSVNSTQSPIQALTDNLTL